MPLQEVVAARRSGGSAEVKDKVVRARAPYRLGLAGGGTDVSPFCDRHGGIVVNATIDRYCYATVQRRDDGRVVLESVDRAEGAELAGDIAVGLPLHVATYRRMCADFDLGRPAVTVSTIAEAPPGSGLGSSSTLVVAMVEAYREYFGLPLGDYEVARLAYTVERVDCGLSGGRQDQYAATFGGVNSIEFHAGERVIVNPLRIKPAILQEFEASLVLYDTGVSRRSANIIDRQARHVEEGSASQLEATLALKGEAVAMKEALLRGDFHGVAQVLRAGWEAKRKLAEGVSTPAIERAFEVATAAGALAGKVSGAGGGGFILFVVEPLRRPAVVAALGSLAGGTVQTAHFVEDGAVAWRLR